MSNDHHEMDEDDMEEENEEGQMSSVAWSGMNLREQIKGTFDLL
jgi:hypothetical protein